MAGGVSTAFSCSCGQLRGIVSPVSARFGTHAICHCRDCRAAALYLRQPDPAPNGVEIFQTTPDTVDIQSGGQHLGLLRLGPKGLLRWYATCCSSPLFNTFARPGVPFVGIIVDRLQDRDVLGPLVAHGFVPQPDGTSRHKGVATMVWRMLARVIAARLSGRWRQTPFFDIDTGAPVAEATIPGKEERAALYR